MNQAEAVLYSHLTSPDSLDVLADEGFSIGITQEIIPAELGRKVVAWALDYYYANGRKVAPTRDAILQTWGDQMEAVGIEVEDDIETDSVEWAIEQLRSEYARWRSEQLVREISHAVANADGPDRIIEIQKGTQAFYLLSQSLVSRRNEVDLGYGVEAALVRHEELRKSGHITRGLTFGMPEIDRHTFGVHPGELALFAAFSGVGKSWFLLKTVLAEWKAGRKVLLATLENTVDMSIDRVVCMYCRVDYEAWQKGEAHETEVAKVQTAMQQFKDSPHCPIFLMPQPGERTGLSLVRRALLLGADSLIIDQLSHMEPPMGTRSAKRHERFAETIMDLKQQLIGHEPLPCLLAHQIKREGHTVARKTGHYVMEDLAESSEAERSADMVFSVYQSNDAGIAQTALMQMLKFRRGKLKNWEMWWRLSTGDIRVQRELTDEDVRGSD